MHKIIKFQQNCAYFVDVFATIMEIFDLPGIKPFELDSFKNQILDVCDI